MSGVGGDGAQQSCQKEEKRGRGKVPVQFTGATGCNYKGNNHRIGLGK